jgi:hypothetical protein
MKTLLATLFLALLPISAAYGQTETDLSTATNEEIIADADSLHPAALYILASRLLAAGEGQEAANWMYAGQLRYRFMISARSEAESQDDRVLFSALSEQVGRPVNEYIAGDPDEWIAAMQWALDWDEATENNVTSKTEHAETLAEIRAGLQSLIEQVDTSRDEIREQRAANGLENR